MTTLTMRLRATTWGLVIISLAAPAAWAQQVRAPDSGLASAYRLNFTVPESPAFNVLNVDKSNLLRPSTVKELSAAFSGFLGSGGGFVLPRSFGAEFAPALLINGDRLTRARYKALAPLYRMRVSAATRRQDSSSAATQISLGIRTAFIDNADLRTSGHADQYAEFVTTAAAERVGMKQELVDSIVQSRPGPPNEALAARVDSMFISGVSDKRRAVLLRASGVPNNAVARLLAVYRRVRSRETIDAEALARERLRLEAESWNAGSLEFAVAALGEAEDSTGKDLRIERYSAWLTAAFRLGSWGQLLTGAEFGAARDTLTSAFGTRGSLSGRLYVGTNRLKIFLEAQGDFAEQRDVELLFNSGGEFRLPIGGWIGFSAGVNRDAVSKRYALVTNFSLHVDVKSLVGLL